MKEIIAELVNRFGQLSTHDILHRADSTHSLKVDHVTLVMKPYFKKVEHRFLDADSVVFSL